MRCNLYPIDIIVIGYGLFMALICSLLGSPLSAYIDEIIWYLSLAALTALIIRYMNEEGPGWQRLIRLLYPMLIVSIFYRLTGGTMHLLYDRFFDYQVVAFEREIFSDNLTLYIDRNLLNIWTTEILSFSYFTYYFYLPGFFFSIFILKKNELIKRAMFGVILTYFLSYFLFWLYPVEGPRWFFAGQYLNSVDGLLFRPLVEFVIDNGAVRGGAMPSSHTGVALAVLVYCFIYFRRAAWLIAPVVFGLSLGTVWGRFHYASDVVVGSAIALFSVWLERKYYDRWTGSIGRKTETNNQRALHVT